MSKLTSVIEVYLGQRCIVFLLAVLSASCDAGRQRSPNLNDEGDRDSARPEPSKVESTYGTECPRPAEGCICAQEGEVVACGKVKRSVGEYITCSMGKRECIGGLWGACQGDRVVMTDTPNFQLRLAATPVSGPCVDNPCDPYCSVFEDAPEDVELEVGSNVELGDDGLQLIPVPPTTNGSPACTGIAVQPSTQTFEVTSFPGSHSTSNGGAGLTAEYFTGFSASGLAASTVPTTIQVDPQINFTWAGSPTTGIGSDSFTVRWTGYIIPTTSGVHRFYPTADDGVKLWLDNVLLVNAWVNQGATEYTSPAVTLQAGVPYAIRMEHYDGTGAATAILRWQGPSSANVKTPVATQFFTRTATVACSPGVLQAETMTHTAGGGTQDGWNIWSNGYIYGNFAFGTPTHTLTVRAKGTSAQGGWPRMLLSVGGTPLSTTIVTSPEWADYSFDYSAGAGTKEVRIEFDNDFSGNGEDRNLMVDKVSITCPPATLGVAPADKQFTVSAVPSNCFAGEVPAAWTLDNIGTSIIDQTGTMRVVAPVAGPITVSAHAGNFVDDAAAQVRVNVRDATAVSAVVAAKFNGAGSGVDPMTVVYPYQDTVFPLGLRSPIIQWEKNGTTAAAVRVALVWPVGGTPDFLWERIVPEPNPGRLDIPTEVWKAFEQTAKADDAAYVVQRLINGSLKSEVVRPIRFASAPLRGRILYTEYGRADFHAYMMGLDPGGTQGAFNLFQNTPGANGCPVCHSVSANGTTFLTSDAAWSNTPGVSSIGANGTLTNLSDYSSSTTYRTGADDWRGFAWAPLTPTGDYALAANNPWGNTRQAVVGINASRQVTVPNNMVSGGNGIGLLAEYFPNTTFTGTAWKRTDPIVNFDWVAGTPGGVIPVDNFSARWTGFVQPYYSESHTFYLVSSDGVKLTVNNSVVINDLNYAGVSRTASGTITLQRGVKYSILLEYKETTGNAAVKLEWQSANTPRAVVPQTQLYWNHTGRGALVTYYDNINFTTQKLQRVEPQIAANWVAGSPDPSVGIDTFSTRWDTQLQPPVTGMYTFCASANDSIDVRLNGTSILSGANTPVNICSAAISLTGGQNYPLVVDHTENTTNASLQLDWQATVSGSTVLAREAIPQERLLLPSTYTAPTNGLTATYYDNIDYNATLAANPTSARAFTRVQPTVNHDWGSSAYREEYYRLQDSINLSGRLTGQLQASCTGVTEFHFDKDDGGSLWIGGIRVASRTLFGATDGAVHMTSGQRYDLKIDWDQGSGGSFLKLQWKPCGVGSFVTVPNSALFPTGDTGAAGFVRAGGDNGSGTDYFVWQVAKQSGVASTDVTTASPGKWGLQGATLMVPTFSPDGTKLAFVDGDQAGGSGWRKGLSTYNFSSTGRTFSGRRLIVDNWPFGDVVKWPAFESDSRSVIYSTSPPGTYCCINAFTTYGYMAPTDYYEAPGRLMSVDVQAGSPTPTFLQRATIGERAIDANKAWQPTVLPVAAGGYRWAVFTSSRPYGNTVNLTSQNDYTNTSSFTPMTNTSAIQSQLWVTAIDDTVSGNSDRSYPAFWLPNQNYHETPSLGFTNERAYWTLEPCRSTGSTAASECEVDEDCCGHDTDIAACRIDVPVTIPITRHCAAVATNNTCSLPGGSCATSDDCCTGTLCVNSECAAPPSLDIYLPGNVERIYQAECRFDSTAVWRFFDWQATTPDTNSYIQFYAETAADPNDFHDLPAAPTPVTTPGVVLIGTATGPSVNGWIGNDVGPLLETAGVGQREYVKITMRLAPNVELTASPVLHDFRLNFSCLPAQ